MPASLRGLAVVFLLVLSPVVAAADDAPALRLPQGWLGAIHTSSLSDARSLAKKTTTELGYHPSVVLALLDLVLKGIDPAVLGDGPIAIGGCENETGEPFPFVLLTPPDFQALIDELGGERTGETAVVEHFGAELTLAPFGDHAIAVLSNDEKHLQDVAPEKTPLPTTDGLAVSFSNAGFARMAKHAADASPQRRLLARRLLRHPWQWPPRMAKLDAVFGLNTALWRRLEERFAAAHVSISSDSGGEVVARFTLAPLESLAIDEPSTASSPLLTDSVLQLDVAAAAACVPELLGLLTAYQQGRPDEIRAVKFAKASYAEYERRLQTAASLVERVEADWLTPEQDEPAAANMVLVLHTRDTRELINAITSVAPAWNKLVVDSKARDRLVYEQRPLEQDDPQGVEFRSDLVAATNVTDTPEVRQLMDRYVGNDGWHTLRVVEVDLGRVLVTDAPLAQAMSAVDKPAAPDRPAAASPASNQVAAGWWRLDRHAAWMAMLTRIDNANAEPVLMAPTPPVAIQVRAKDQRLEVELRADTATLRSLGEYLRQE